MEFITHPWPWYVAGPVIAFVMFLLYYFGERFGVSSNLETFCSIGGAGKFVDYFKIDWKNNSWNLVFVAGAITGGFIAAQWMSPSDAATVLNNQTLWPTPSESVALNPQTIQDLADIGIQNAGTTYLPDEIFSIEAMFTLKDF